MPGVLIRAPHVRFCSDGACLEETLSKFPLNSTRIGGAVNSPHEERRNISGFREERYL